MNIYRAIAILIIVSSFVVMNGCSKHSSNPESPQAVNNTPPSLPKVDFSAPQTNSNAPVMSLISGYVESLNALKSYSNSIEGVKPVFENNNWVWKYERNGVTITLTAELQSDGNYHWNVFLTGLKDNLNFVNCLTAEGISSPDGKTGTWKVYKGNTTEIEGEYSWNKASDGTITGTAKAYNNGKEAGVINLLNHADRSGQVEVYVLNNLFFKADWQSDGSGEWWRYGLNGTVIDKGSWK